MIADAKLPVAIGGIMGGEDSAAIEKTKTIVFECAVFDPVLIRKTSRALNLRSDSSDLFEKGLKLKSTESGILRAIELTQKLAGGKVASAIISVGAKPNQSAKIKFDTAGIKRHLDIEIPLGTVKKILGSLGFSVSGSKILNVSVPWWRAGDVVFDYDLIEEVARIYGYHNLPTHLPLGQIPIQSKDPIFLWENTAKNILVGLGFSEAYNYSMTSEKALRRAEFINQKLIRLFNPLNEEMEVMRPTLIGGILQNVSDNLKNYPELKIFELSNIYLPQGDKDLPRELLKLTGAIVDVGQQSFFTAKGTAELLLKKLGILNYELKPTDPACPIWQKGQALDIYISNKYLGQFGLISQNLLDNFGLNKSVALFDFDFSLLASLAKSIKTYKPIQEFPSITRDLEVIVDFSLAWRQIEQLVSRFNPLIVGVEYLSIFTGKDLGDNKKSIAFRLIFRSTQRTLKSEEVDDIIKRLIGKLEADLNAKLR